MKATDLLKQQHDEVKGLFERLVSGDETEREELCDELVRNLVAHSAIEKEIMYPACIEAMPELIQRSKEEHGMVEFGLRKLLDIKASDETFEPKIEVLKEIVMRHVEKEESELFPGAQALGDAQLEQLGEEMESRFDEVLAEDPRPLLDESLGLAKPRRAAARKPARRATSAPRQSPRAKRTTGARSRSTRSKPGRKSSRASR